MEQTNEYIRNGLEFNKFWDNVNKIFSKCPRVNITFMVTYNNYQFQTITN